VAGDCQRVARTRNKSSSRRRGGACAARGDGPVMPQVVLMVLRVRGAATGVRRSDLADKRDVEDVDVANSDMCDELRVAPDDRPDGVGRR
jgi:hypothetical protein